MITNLIFAGTDTVRQTVELICVLAARHPEILQRIHDDYALAPNVVEEILRYEPISLLAFRTPATDLELGGVALTAGETVIMNLASADRDPMRWDAPDVLDLDRNPVRTIDFGGGAHMCLGAALVRTELQEFLVALSSRCSEVTLHGEPCWAPYRVLRKLVNVDAALVPRC
jgi:cytochrome P450